MYLLVTGLQSVIFAAVAAGLIFGLAGRWDSWNVWVYVGILLALSLFRDLVMYRKSPDLLKERLKPASGGRDGKLLIIFVGALVLFLLHWSVRRARSALSLVGPYPAGRGGCRIGDRGCRCGVWYLADAGQSILFYRGTYPVGSRATGDHQWAIRNRAASRLCGLGAGIGRQRGGSQFGALNHPGGDHGGCCCPSNGNRGPDAAKRISRIS